MEAITVEHIGKAVLGSSDMPDQPRETDAALDQFPTKITFGERDYFLRGIVAHVPGHYFAYCRRVTGTWDLYNDTTKKPERNITKDSRVRPHHALYTI